MKPKKVVENGLQKKNNVVCTGGKQMIESRHKNGFHCPHFGTEISPILIALVLLKGSIPIVSRGKFI